MQKKLFIKLSNKKNGQGFGLVELIIVMAIISILAAIAAPRLGGALQSNTLTEATNRFVSSMALARNEAVNRNQQTVMCASNAAANVLACTNNNQWENGWILFIDTDGNNAVTAGEQIVLLEAGLPNNYTLRAGNAQFRNRITFDTQGNAAGDGGNGVEVFRVCDPTGNAATGRAINLNGIGRAWVNSAPGTVACP